MAAADSILYLSRRDVACALAEVEVVETVAAALAAHARGQTVLPEEAYLYWAHAGDRLRSLSMPGLVDGFAGVKVINANAANPGRGQPRASGLTLLFDVASGRPVCVLEAARISCVRTAAVTALVADLLGAEIRRVALIGAGALARCHVEVLLPRLPLLEEVLIYDLDEGRAAALAARVPAAAVSGSAEEAIRGADLVVPLTTTTEGYIRRAWLQPGALLVNVSLDDPLPEVVLRADRVFVDDWALVASDGRRLLGRMFRAGKIGPPDDEAGTAARPIDGELGDLVVGARPGRTRPDEVIVVNPFGLAIEDVAVAGRVYRRARERGLGMPLER